MNDEQTAIRTTYFSIAGNTGLAIIKGLAGFFGNSYALIADAIESTADILASLLVLFGFMYAKRPADENHPYGHGKIEPLITFLVVRVSCGIGNNHCLSKHHQHSNPARKS
ncbi:MAG: cation transporter [Cytophagales bacterium]|nr:cation transporter [Cytophagales bacterium]